LLIRGALAPPASGDPSKAGKGAAASSRRAPPSAWPRSRRATRRSSSSRCWL